MKETKLDYFKNVCINVQELSRMSTVIWKSKNSKGKKKNSSTWLYILQEEECKYIVEIKLKTISGSLHKCPATTALRYPPLVSTDAADGGYITVITADHIYTDDDHVDDNDDGYLLYGHVFI